MPGFSPMRARRLCPRGGGGGFFPDIFSVPQADFKPTTRPLPRQCLYYRHLLLKEFSFNIDWKGSPTPCINIH